MDSVLPADGGALQRLVDCKSSVPIWDPDGKRLYFRDAGRMMVATIARDPALRVVSKEALFYTRSEGDYDLAKDGRFLMIQTDASNTSLVVIPNWRTELKRLTPR